jgi:hypothetical protein
VARPLEPQPAGGIAAYVLGLLVAVCLLVVAAAYLGYHRGLSSSAGLGSDAKGGGKAGAAEGAGDGRANAETGGGSGGDSDDSDDGESCDGSIVAAAGGKV